MKRCLQCRRRYSDDSLNFCLDDGSPLSAEPDSEPTLVSPPATIPFAPRATAVPSTPVVSAAAPFRWGLMAGVVLIALLLGGGAVALFFQFNNSGSQSEGARSETPGTNAPTPALKSPSPNQEPTPAPAPNLSGEWRVTNTIENTSYPAYTNLRIGYRLVIKQSGNEFTAEGEKSTENGRSMEDSERTPLTATGSVDQNSVTADFVEEGIRRRTTGRFVWTLSADGNTLHGTFTSTAAKSSGSSVATRER